MTRLSRRELLGGIAAAGVTATGGCLNALSGDEPLEFSSAPVSVKERTAADAGYELLEQRKPELSRKVDVAGQTREVTVTNYTTVYAKNIDMGPLGEQQAGMFATLTTPQIKIAGQAFNPIAEMSTRDLLDEVGSRYENLSVNEKVGSTDVQTLGTTATVEKFEATASIQGQEVQLFLHVTRVKHGEDYVVAVGGYPRQLSGEGETVLTLVKQIVHG